MHSLKKLRLSALEKALLSRHTSASGAEGETPDVQVAALMLRAIENKSGDVLGLVNHYNGKKYPVSSSSRKLWRRMALG